VIESEFTFFEVKIKGFPWNSIELCKSSFGIRPEGFNAINVAITSNKFIFTMMHTKMLFVPHVDQPIVASPAVRVDHTVEPHLASDRAL